MGETPLQLAIQHWPREQLSPEEVALMASWLEKIASLGEKTKHMLLAKTPAQYHSFLQTVSPQTPSLQAAAETGQTTLIKHYLEQGNNLNQALSNGQSLLHITVNKGHIHDSMMLCQRGAQLQATDNSGNTAFHLAVAQGHTEMVRMLAYIMLKQRLPLNPVNGQGDSPLHIALKHGHEEIVKMLSQVIREVCSKEAERSQWGYHIFHSKDYKLRLVYQTMLATQDAAGDTPLEWAYKNGKNALADVLIQQYGAKNSSAKVSLVAQLGSSLQHILQSLTGNLVEGAFQGVRRNLPDASQLMGLAQNLGNSLSGLQDVISKTQLNHQHNIRIPIISDLADVVKEWLC